MILVHISQMAKNDKFNNERDKDPDRSVEFISVFLILVGFDCLFLTVPFEGLDRPIIELIGISAQEGQITVLIFHKWIMNWLSIFGSIVHDLWSWSFCGLLSHCIVAVLVTKHPLAEGTVFKYETVWLTTWKEWPNGIKHLLCNLCGTSIEVNLVFIGVKDPSFEESWHSLIRYGLLSKAILL